MRGALGFQGQTWQGYSTPVPSLCCAEGGRSACSRVPVAGTPFAEGARGKICGFAASWLAKGHTLLCLLDAFPCLLPETQGGWCSLGRGRGRGCWLSEWLAWSLAVHPDGLCCSPAGQGWSKLLAQTMSWRVPLWSLCSPRAMPLVSQGFAVPAGAGRGADVCVPASSSHRGCPGARP